MRIEHLPIEIHHLGEIDTSKIQPPGLLYLENKYVVPGGRFNEMYGWDSYFIIRGLLRAGRVELARGMVDNFFFEIEHYGAMLNANRTYYLTRSQPPFLSSMFVDVYDALQKSGRTDPAWLAKAYADLEKDYEMWNRDPHLAGETGLSRYYDFGEGPPPEAAQDESGFYRKVATYFFFHPAQADDYIVESQPTDSQQSTGWPTFTLQVCGVSYTMARADCDQRKEFKLSSDYYKGDRSMRESGFDVSFRFGPFGACHASLCAGLSEQSCSIKLKRIWSRSAAGWDATPTLRNGTSAQRNASSSSLRYLWDDAAGFFFDYNLGTGQKILLSLRHDPLSTLGGPGHSRNRQERVAKNLPVFESPADWP